MLTPSCKIRPQGYAAPSPSIKAAPFTGHACWQLTTRAERYAFEIVGSESEGTRASPSGVSSRNREYSAHSLPSAAWTSRRKELQAAWQPQSHGIAVAQLALQTKCSFCAEVVADTQASYSTSCTRGSSRSPRCVVACTMGVARFPSAAIHARPGGKDANTRNKAAGQRAMVRRASGNQGVQEVSQRPPRKFASMPPPSKKCVAS